MSKKTTDNIIKDGIDYLKSITYDTIGFEEFYTELKYVLKHEKKEIIADCKQDIKCVIKDVAKNIKKTFCKIYSFSKEQIVKIKKQGIKQTFINVKSFVTSKVENCKKSISSKENFLQWVFSSTASLANTLFRGVIKTATFFIKKLKQDYESFDRVSDKIKYTICIILQIIVLLKAFSKGYNTPDKDWAVSGLTHRNFITHSVIPFLALIFVGYFTIHTLERVERRIKKNTVAVEVASVLKGVMKAAMIGYGIGITAHLLEDTFIDRGGAVNFQVGNLGLTTFGASNNSLYPGTRIDDMAYVAVMSIFSGSATKSVIDKKITI